MLSVAVDRRIGGITRYYLPDPEVALMNVPDEIRKCVAFLQLQTGTGLKLAGTVFFVGFEEEGEPFAYAVTAKHIIEKIRRQAVDGQTYFRMNNHQGGVETFQASADRWVLHPTDSVTDLAVLPLPIEIPFDMRLFPLRNGSVTPDVIKREGIGIGEEVFTVGLFYHHCGTQRNLPILRIGNIAAMAEEPVAISNGELMEAYLIEMRSIGGLSGSPVFVHPAPIRFGTFGRVDHTHYLFGLMHGHWNLGADMVDELPADELTDQPLNTGIGVVVPVAKIIEAIDQERLAERRREEIKERRKRNAPTPDIKPPKRGKE